MFKDRKQAGRMLAERLSRYKNGKAVILAIPRGGVIIGYEAAEELNLPLEIMLIKKIGHPLNREFSIGSVSLFGYVIDPRFSVTKEFIEMELTNAIDTLKSKHKLFMSGREPVSLKGKVVIIIDDGIATGNTMLTIIGTIKESHPARIIIAVPVASPRVIETLEKRVDEIICLESPEDFRAVSQYYRHFEQVSDDEVISLLKKSYKKEMKLL